MRRVGVVIAVVALISLGGCSDEADEYGSGSGFHYPTHCGVAQVGVGDVLYYPTGIYLDGELVYSGSGGDRGGPMPWESLDDPEVSDNLHTYGEMVVADDGTAEFFVNGTDYSVRLSDDEADAAWTIEGCA